MIVRTAQAMKDLPDRFLIGSGWESTRLLLAQDGMGYSLHETVLQAGQELFLHYRNHLEANYCISGQGEVADLANGTVHPIGPGSLYALDQHDMHRLKVIEGPMRLICLFSPALNGTETHEAGGYTPTQPVA